MAGHDCDEMFAVVSYRFVRHMTTAYVKESSTGRIFSNFLAILGTEIKCTVLAVKVALYNWFEQFLDTVAMRRLFRIRMLNPDRKNQQKVRCIEKTRKMAIEIEKNNRKSPQVTLLN